MTVNVSPFAPIHSKSYRRDEYDQDNADDSVDAENSEDQFYFGIDMGPYWLAPLGRCFGVSQARVEREALRVIRSDWQMHGLSRWDEDERHRRKIFRERETSHSHGSYPRTDELRFYLSYHAMMVVAGKLLATRPVHCDPDDQDDEFRDWFKYHDLSRPDLGWVADRRDPDPLESPAWRDEAETDEWRWSIKKGDFDQFLLASNSRLNLWGNWKRISGNREESIRITSALVSSDRSMALLRALQSATNPHDYRIPDADDELQIDVDGFQLKGWIVDHSRDSQLDEYDPWAGGIRYPPLVPASYVIELMKLNSDIEHRRWFANGKQEEVAWSQVWGHLKEKDDDGERHESGERFQASFAFIMLLLRQLKMDLIVDVEVERRRRYSQWESTSYDELGFIQPSSRLFLLRSDGSINTM
jgi:hypothetical protein